LALLAEQVELGLECRLVLQPLVVELAQSAVALEWDTAMEYVLVLEVQPVGTEVHKLVLGCCKLGLVDTLAALVDQTALVGHHSLLCHLCSLLCHLGHLLYLHDLPEPGSILEYSAAYESSLCQNGD